MIRLPTARAVVTLAKMVALPVLQADCSTFPCREECCSVGVDVWPDERQRLIDEGMATESDFTGPELDEDDLLYRTAIGPRGCVFLLPTRGCRLHTTGLKPVVCTEVPRDRDEVDELAGYDMLPCHDQWQWSDE